MSGLLVYDRTCPLCDGLGLRIETVFESYQRARPCKSCDGTGKVARPYGWRPYEPCKEET